ncbi:hypothetical protein BCR34DRAFT_29495 [Clohesyomyces aquaticus]|uniref:Uncharacterized protein n=1 Tax=Clohesyomyces aquaticus TaxID=1231657 RepID=A0A1Y1ZA17_9PLEO|nr:hypothetical protein BCR34DRAFT_29495 [Clohesyomyces aquaticus]
MQTTPFAVGTKSVRRFDLSQTFREKDLLSHWQPFSSSSTAPQTTAESIARPRPDEATSDHILEVELGIVDILHLRAALSAKKWHLSPAEDRSMIIDTSRVEGGKQTLIHSKRGSRLPCFVRNGRHLTVDLALWNACPISHLRFRLYDHYSSLRTSFLNWKPCRRYIAISNPQRLKAPAAKGGEFEVSIVWCFSPYRP